MSEALGLVTIGEKGGEVFLGASLQDLGSVGPETLNLIDNEVERLVGDAEARAERDPRPQLEHRRGDRDGAARAGDALRRRARRGALDRPGDLASRTCARCAGRRPRDSRCATRRPRRERSGSGARGRASHRAPSPALVIALIALVLLDHRTGRRRTPRGRQRRRRPPDQHQATRRRSCCSAQERQVPGLRDPDRQERQPGRREDGRTARRHLPAGDRRPRHVVPGHRALSADQRRRRQEQLHLGQQGVRGRRRLAAHRRAADRRGGPRQARVDDPRLAADGDDPPRPEPRPERRTRDELDARHHRSRLGGGRLRGCERRRRPATRARDRPTRCRCRPIPSRNRCST